MTIFKCPRILTIHFLRFTYTGRKIGKHIKFPKSFNLRVFVSENVDSNVPKEEQTNHIYDLYGVIVHAGQGSKCGHYYSFVKKANKWYLCNDERVTEVKDIDQVMKQNAYMLVYKYKTPTPVKKTKTEKAAEFVNPSLSRTKSLTVEINETHQNKNNNIMPLSGYFESKEEVNSEEEEEKLVTKEEVPADKKEKFEMLDYIMANFEDLNMDDIKNLDIMKNLSCVSLNDDFATPELKSYISNTLALKKKQKAEALENGTSKSSDAPTTAGTDNGIKIPLLSKKRKRSMNKEVEEVKQTEKAVTPKASTPKNGTPKPNKRTQKENHKQEEEPAEVLSNSLEPQNQDSPSKDGKKKKRRNRKKKSKNGNVEESKAGQSTTNRKFDNLVKRILSSN